MERNVNFCFKKLVKGNLPLVLVLILYILIFFIRSGQGGWEPKTDFFKPQRDFLDQRIAQLLPSPQAELMSGVLLGQNKNLPGQLKLSLRDTSTLHIVVASGQNLSILAGFFLGLAGLIKRRNAIFLSLSVAIFFTLLSGMQVPILRAAIMFGFASLAQLSGRQSDGWWVLIVTGALMLLVNPSWIGNLSFQLSFLATFGVVVVSPVILKSMQKIPIIGPDLAVTLAAQIMVTPVIAINFHQISLVSLITNALVLWTIPFMMVLGIVMLLFSFIFSGAAFILSLFASALLTYFIYIVSFFASFPFAWEYVGEQIWVVWVGYYLVLGGVLMGLSGFQKTQNNSELQLNQKI